MNRRYRAWTQSRQGDRHLDPELHATVERVVDVDGREAFPGVTTDPSDLPQTTLVVYSYVTSSANWDR